jgi:flagellar hook-associated protein 2
MSSLSSLGDLSSLNTSGIQFAGLASGVDTNQLIKGLVALQQAQITRLQNQQAKVQQEQSAFRGLESNLLALQTQSDRLAATFHTAFDGRTVSSSNSDLATGAASSGAAPGVYQFTVNQLARAEQRTSQGFASATSTVAQGTVQIQVGSGTAKTITIDGSNNTLQGLANAINASGADVTAAVVNDGTTSGTPYRLLLTSKLTGKANTINFTTSATDGGTQVNPSQIVQASADAQITLGSGAGALAINSPTNQVNTVFNGVTLNLTGADPTKTVTLTVANDTGTASKSVHDFVGAFNDLIDNINAQTKYDPKTNRAGLLLGDSSVTGLQDAVTRAVTGVVPGVNGKANRLAAIGITLDDHGKLTVDDTKLNAALSGQTAGVTINDVRRLFALDGVSDTSSVQFVTAAAKTQASATPYQVNVTRAASQASVAAANPLADPNNVAIGASNNTLTLTVNGKTSGTITLASASYNAQTLAQEVQKEINADSQLAGTSVAVSVTADNRLQIVSQAFGSGSQVTITGGSALNDLGFSNGQTASGQDVAGTFTVPGGGTETATGAGQTLTGTTGNAYTDGLKVLVSSATAPVTANLTVTRGLASSLDQVLNKYLDPVNGRLKIIDQSLQGDVDNIQKSIDEQQASLTARQQQLIQQFAAMESTISQLKSTGNYLTNQLNNLR